MASHINKICDCMALPSTRQQKSFHLSFPYLSFLLLHPQDPGCYLDGGKCFSIVPCSCRNVSYHGGTAVHVPKGLAEQHGQLAVSAK